MQVKRYEAASIREAMTKIKKDLGSDAILLSTKRLRESPTPLLEIIAAREIDEKGFSAFEGCKKGGDSPSSNEQSLPASDVIHQLRGEIDELKTLIREMNKQRCFHREFVEWKESMNVFFDVIGLQGEQGANEIWSSIYYTLLGRGLSRQWASKMIESIKNNSPSSNIENHEEGLRTIQRMIEKSFAPFFSDEKKRRVKVLVGPTGVGKTTTLAKLAARYALEKKWKVGLVTTDTFRIAATDQLKVYADIIGIPMEIASEKEGFQRSLRKFGDRDVILVDTPGNSGHNDNFLRKMKDLMATDIPVQTDLLLSLASGSENILDAAERFGIFDFDHIILTKFDECVRFGNACEAINRIGKPVLYVTTGQNVPQDIEDVTPGKLAEWVMENNLH